MDALLIRVGWKSSKKSHAAGNFCSFSQSLSLQVYWDDLAVPLCDSWVVCINGLAGDFTGNKVKSLWLAVVSSVSKPQKFVDFQAGFNMTNHGPSRFDWHFGNVFSGAEISF